MLSPHFTALWHTLKWQGPQGHLDRVPLPRGVKFKTTFIITKKAFLSASAHLTLIIASIQGRKAIKLGWVLNSLSPQCSVQHCVMAGYSSDIEKGEIYSSASLCQ